MQHRHRNRVTARALAAALCLTLLGTAPASAQRVSAAQRAIPDSLLSVDVNRSAVIDRVLASWGTELPQAQTTSFAAQLNALRADELLAVSLAGSFEGVLKIMQVAQRSAGVAVDRAKAVGETTRDLVYTPIVPKRLLDSRGAFIPTCFPGGGAYSNGEIRSFDITAASCLPVGVSAIVATVYAGPAAVGAVSDVYADAQGGSFGAVAVEAIGQASGAFTGGTALIPVNPGNNQIAIKNVVTPANIIIDVTGYFTPANRTGDGLRVFGGGTSSPSVVNGDDSNTVGAATRATISGGSNNTATGNGSTIGGGSSNQATGLNSTIFGGFNNQSSNDGSFTGGGYNNISSGLNSVVGGGGSNTASGGNSVAVGGANNVASGNNASIGGGWFNVASGQLSHIGGGQGNLASGNSATVSGGWGNRATAFATTVAGGGSGPTSTCLDAVLQTNTAPCWNEATDNNATVSGGINNRASSNSATVAGGWQNSAAAGSSAVAGGTANSISANGGNSFIGGGLRNSVTGNTSTVVGGGGGINAGFSSFIGSGGSGTGSNCYNHITAANDVSCWNEIGVNGNVATIVGGYDNRTNNFGAFIGGGASNSVTQNDSAIVGGWANLASNYAAFIGGGYRNTASGDSSVVVGGGGNKATARGSVVVGGGFGGVSTCFNFVTSLNDRPCWNESNASASIVGAGSDNVIGATVSIGNSAIVSGASNRNAGDKSFLGGGTTNTISQDDGLVTPTNVNSAVLVGGRFNTVKGFAAALVGGSENIASGPRAFVGAGRNNTASGDRSAIVGGGSTSLTCYNKATGLQDFSCANVSSGQYAFVGAGVANRASGNQSVISGGVDNDASGFRSTVAGGSTNTASGTGSFAAGRANWASGSWSMATGRGAQTNTGGATPTHHFGTFVWADSPDDGTPATPFATQVFRSTADNQFAVRARGGVSFKVGAPAIADPTDPGYVSNAADTTPGCSLPAGGAASWSCTSDRNTKEAIKAISPKAILAKVTALPLSTWQFKGTERRHLSPMAQDFWAAFGLGVNDKAITSSDVSGVALGAIQGLNQKLATQIKQKDAEIAMLKRDMAAIKKKLGL